MKKFITSMILFFVTAVSISQISNLPKPLKQTKIGTLGSVLITCDRYETISIFQFNDSKYQQIKVPVSFTLNNAEFEELYIALSNKFAQEEYAEDDGFLMTTKENVKIIFKFSKMMGIKSVKFGIEKNGTTSLGSNLTQKQIKKLFDKSN